MNECGNCGTKTNYTQKQAIFERLYKIEYNYTLCKECYKKIINKTKYKNK